MNAEEKTENGQTVDPNHDVYFVPGLQRGLTVLESIATEQRPLSVTEVATRLSITRSSAFRLIYTLRHMGFLQPVPNTKSFTLGGRILSLGFSYLASMNIIDVARPELEVLRDVTNVTAHLAIREKDEILYLSCIQSKSGFLSTINVGARFSAHAVPMGWLLLADLSPRQVAAIFSNRTLAALTKQTPVTVETLLGRVTEAGAAGYVISRGIIEPGGSSISAPVFDQTGQTVAAIDIAGPDTAFDINRLKEHYMPAVVAAAKRISARLGHTG